MGSSQSYNYIAATQWYLDGRKTYGAAGYERARASWFKDSDICDMTGKVVAITGANKGLGFAAAKQVAELKAEVHLLCRNLTAAEEAKKRLVEVTKNSNIFVHECDASDFDSIRAFGKKFSATQKPIHVLVNNAGGMPAERTENRQGKETIMACGLGGTMLLTSVCLPFLAASGDGRVINVSSGGGYTVKCPDPEDLNFDKMKQYNPTLFYAFTKRAQLILTEQWTKRHGPGSSSALAGKVRFHCMHPGWATTEGVADALEGGRLGLDNTDGFRTAAQGADTITFLASTSNEEVKQSGEMWFERRVSVKHYGGWFGGTTSSNKLDERLWAKASEFVGGLPSE
jgi:dehydrogenase/reductase SDR family protein 12